LNVLCIDNRGRKETVERNRIFQRGGPGTNRFSQKGGGKGGEKGSWCLSPQELEERLFYLGKINFPRWGVPEGGS